MEVDFLHKNIWQSKSGKGKGPIPSSWHASFKNIFNYLPIILYVLKGGKEIL